MPDVIDREACIAMDREDPLAEFRDRFAIDEAELYLDGNSLGRLPKATVARMHELVETEWGHGLVRSWTDARWMESPQRVGDKLARLIGAGPDEVLVTDNTSVDVFKLAGAVLGANPQRRIVLTERENFPTDRYVAQGVAALLGEREVRFVERSRLAESLNDEIAVLLLTHVDYATGERHDMQALTAAAHRAGALALWDLSHSTGAVRVDVHGCDVDLAAGCGYKYLNGGPGAPAYLFVARQLQEALRNPIQGWLSHEDPFAFDAQYRPASGIRSWMTGSPSVLQIAALEVAVDMFLEADMDRVGAKAEQLTELFIKLADGRLARHGFEVATPRDPSRRGAHVSLRHRHGFAIVRALIDRGVIGDFRPPDLCRFGFAPLYTRYVDLWEAAGRILEVMDEEAYLRPAYTERTYIT